MASRMVVQRHVRWRFTSRFWSLWCEGFAPHTANSRFPIPRCVPLHHWRNRGPLCRDEESSISTRHDELPCMTHGGIVLFVLRLVESVCVIAWPLVRWCKGTYGGASCWDSVVRRLRTTYCKLSPSDFLVCAFAPPQKRPQSVGP